MPIPCALCNEKEFSVILETHHPIKEQPVIICWACLNNYINYYYHDIGHPHTINSILNKYIKQRESLQPKELEC